jgi:sec-independent protein translocase protein TatC
MADQGDSTQSSPYDQLPIMEHLNELRTRIIISLVSIIVAFIIAFQYRELVFAITLQPYGPGFKPIVLDVTERFLNYFKVSMAAGLVIASPMIIYQLMAFIAPALLPNEKRYVYPVVPIILFLFCIGVAFGYYAVLPVSLNFLLSFGSDVISNQIRLDRAISFVTNICLACGAVFQMPVVVFLLAKVGIVNDKFLVKQRKMSIVIIMVLAAVLTPTPDPFTMMLVATPMLLLYEISIIVAKFASPKKKQEEG